jgi:uncharacterized protein (DUF736 family)
LFKKLNKSISAIEETLPIYLILIGAIFCLASTSLTLVNLSQIPLKNEFVALPADKIYNLSGIKSGTPLRFLSPKGKALPSYFDGSFIWVLASLPAGGKERYDVSPSQNWLTFPEVETKWEPEARKGILKNKFLNLEFKEGKISLYTIEGKSLLEGIHFYGWLTEEAIQVPNPKWAEEQGLSHISTLDFSSLQPKEITPYSLAIRKEAGGKLKGRIAYTEKFILHPTLPLIEYILELENLTGKPLFIADCDGIISAGWGEAMKGRKDLILPQGEKIPITKDWMGVSEGQIPPKEQVWMLVNCENRQALGLFNLSKHIHSWCFTDGGMFLYQAGEEGERPIKIPAGGKVSFGLAFRLFENESQARQDAPAILRYLRVGPSISAFLNEEPISLGTVPSFEDDFQKPDRWLVKGGKLGKGRFTAVDEKGEAIIAFSIYPKKPPQLILDLAELKGRLEIEARSIGGEGTFRKEITSPGSYKWDVNIVGDVVLSLFLQGKGSQALFKRLYLGPQIPPAPKLISPSDGSEITDIASFFVWETVEGANEYEFQLSKNPQFINPLSFNSYMQRKSDLGVFFPQEPLSSGKWFWRVRAIGDGGEKGEFSEIRSIIVNTEHKASPILRKVSREHPLFIFHSPSEIEKAWATIPDDIKPYCALRVEVAERGLDFREFCRRAERIGANVVIQCSGPGGGVYGEIYNGRYGRQSLAELEWAFQNCPHIIGAIIVEQFFHYYPDNTSREYAKRLLLLCAKYGRLLIWADGHWVRRGWLKLGEKDPEMLMLIRKYSQYFIPLWKMNCGYEPITIHGSVLGMWICGFGDNFGVEPEDWFWFEAGFGELGEKKDGYGAGRRELMPPTFWGQMMLMGLASGGTCWCLEPWVGLWEEPNKPRESLLKTVIPLIRAIVKWELIPSKESVLREIKIALKTQARDLEGGEGPYGPFEKIFQGTYGIRHPSELIPDNGRYYFVPFLPIICDRPPKGIRLFKTGDFSTPEEIKSFFDSIYPPFYEGDAFLVRVGNLIVAMNSRENEDVNESFNLPINIGNIKSFGGEIAPHSYIVGKEKDGGLLLLINGRLERETRIRLACSQKPLLKISPSEALVNSEWKEGELILTISHKLGSVQMEIK